MSSASEVFRGQDGGGEEAGEGARDIDLIGRLVLDCFETAGYWYALNIPFGMDDWLFGYALWLLLTRWGLLLLR